MQLQQKNNPYGVKGNSQNGPEANIPALKASDKYLIQKFNKEYDVVRDRIVDPEQINFALN